MLTAAATIIETLHARGCRLRVLPGGAIGVRPRRALDPDLREALRIHGREVIRLLEQPADPAVPPPCPTSTVDIIVTELFNDPLVRHALDWSARSAPGLADRVIRALGRIERAGFKDAPTHDLYRQLEEAVDAVLRAEAGLGPMPAAIPYSDSAPTDAPPTWRLVVDVNDPVPGPVRLNVCTVVEDVPRFIRATLTDLEHALAAKNAGNVGSVLVDLIPEHLHQLRLLGAEARVEVVQ